MGTAGSQSGVREPEFFMAFVDGVYDYVCAECTALCCKGHGFSGSLEREMGRLFQIYPRMEGQVVGRQGAIVDIMTPPSGCHFLRPDDRCSIEIEHGKDLKPGVCSLFPFNALKRIGSTITVSPHFLCPLRLSVPAAPGAVQGTHATIAPAVRSSGLLGPDGSGNGLTPLPLHPEADPRSVVEREASFRDRCADAIGSATFFETIREAAEDPDAFSADLDRASRLIGLSPAQAGLPPDACDAVLLAMAAPLRLDLLRLEPDQILLTLALGGLSYRRELTLSDRTPRLQDAFQHLVTLRSTLSLLGHGDRPLKLGKRLEQKVPPSGVPELTFAAFVALRGLASGRNVLTTLETAIPPALGLANRMALLQSLGSMVDKALAKRRERRTAS